MELLFVEKIAIVMPYLAAASHDVAKGAVNRIGEDLWVKVVDLWKRLWPKIEEKPLAKASVEQLAEDPSDKEAQQILASQLSKICEENPSLKEEVAQFLNKHPEEGCATQQNVTGNNNQVIGTVSVSDVPLPIRHPFRPPTL